MTLNELRQRKQTRPEFDTTVPDTHPGCLD